MQLINNLCYDGFIFIYSFSELHTEDDGPQEDQPKPVPWKPVKSLSFLDLELALHGDPSEGEKQEKYMNHEIESSDNYVVVFKEEATAQDGEPITVLPIRSCT